MEFKQISHTPLLDVLLGSGFSSSKVQLPFLSVSPSLFFFLATQTICKNEVINIGSLRQSRSNLLLSAVLVSLEPKPNLFTVLMPKTAYNTKGAKIQYHQLWATVRDPKTYLFAICQMASVLGVGVIGNFLPTLISGFGFSPRRIDRLPSMRDY